MNIPEKHKPEHIPQLKEVFTLALSFYKRKSEFTDDVHRRRVRFRILNKWFNRTYSPQLLEFIDDIANEIGYCSAWEDIGTSYKDDFKVKTFEISNLLEWQQ